MATFNITITAGDTTYGVSDTISSTDLQRLIAAYQSTFGTLDNTSTGLAWANQLIGLTKQTVHKYEELQAVTTARSTITDIAIAT